MTVNNERAEAIRGIQAQMADYGLTMEELEAAGCFDPRPPPPPSAAGVLPQRRGDELGRAGRDAGLAAAGGQCGAEQGVLPGWISPPMHSALCPMADVTSARLLRLGARIRQEGWAQARSERHARDKVSPSMG